MKVQLVGGHVTLHHSTFFYAIPGKSQFGLISEAGQVPALADLAPDDGKPWVVRGSQKNPSFLWPLFAIRTPRPTTQYAEAEGAPLCKRIGPAS